MDNLLQLDWKVAVADRGANEAQRYGFVRSPKWHKVEIAFLATHSTCAACGKIDEENFRLQVHHIFPFHYCVALGRPDLELDPRNLIALCETVSGDPANDHHLLIGHLDDFKSSNLNVVNDALVVYTGMDAGEIRKCAGWLDEERKRLTPLDEMTQDEKDVLRALMDRTFPVGASYLVK